MNDVATRIDQQLAATIVPGSPNKFTAAEIRDLAVEYLETWDEEIEQFPHLRGQPHWTLWMSDASFEDALFTAIVFQSDAIEVLSGTGDAFRIEQFVENRSPKEVTGMFSELRQRFRMPTEPIHIDRAAATEWLGRDWQQG